MKNHPLFPENSDADVEKIHVTRHSAQGTAWAVRAFAPDELTDLSQVFELYGGGKYELVAHGKAKAQKEGEKPRQGICARAAYLIDGPPKPLNQAPEGPPPPMPAAPAPSSGTSDLVAMATLFGNMMQAQTTAMTGLIAAVLSKPQGSGSEAAAIAALGDVVKASFEHRAPAAPANPWGENPVKMFADVADLLSGFRAGIEGAQQKAASGKDISIDLNELGSFADRMMGVFKKGKELADDGKPLDPQTAEQLASEAAGVQ